MPMAKYPADTVSLVADVGGTNTRVALCREAELLTETVRKFSNAQFAGLGAVLREYLDAEPVDCAGAAVAIAGPVRDGRGTLTNLDWSVDPEMLARATQAKTVAVLNDLQAQGYAMGRIDAANLVEVVKGPQVAGGTRLVIGVGTGFNAAVVHDAPGGRIVPPSEAGHANMPLRTEEELRLCKFVETSHGFPAVEDVLSGRGLEHIYAWVCSEAGSHEEMRAADIMSSAETNANAAEAIRWFVRILGTVAGNLSLIHLPFGGVSMIGGVARAMRPYLNGYGFATAFRDKGRFAGFMNNFHVDLVEDDFAALSGLAVHISRQVETSRNRTGFE
ncbi:MAG: glucokinase [Pseudomonadota bacterium]